MKKGAQLGHGVQGVVVEARSLGLAVVKSVEIVGGWRGSQGTRAERQP